MGMGMGHLEFGIVGALDESSGLPIRDGKIEINESLLKILKQHACDTALQRPSGLAWF